MPDCDPGNIITTAGFDYSTGNHDSVLFNNLSSGRIAACYWDFGDGSYSQLRNPVHGFSNGAYTVCLSVKDSSNGISQKCRNIIVNDTNCVASFNYFVNEAKDSVYFADNSTGQIQHWFWNMGNGITCPWQNVWLHLNPGVYNVMLSVNGPGNCISSQNRRVIVGPDSCTGIAGFSYFVNPVNDTVSFLSQAPGWNSIRYYWNFGDGSVSVLPDPVHVYSSSGLQHVVLTISDSTGNCIRTNSQDIQAGNTACSAAFTYFANSTTVSFKNTSIGSATSLNWFFGDGTQSNQANPVHIYPAPGFYKVELNTYNSINRCMDNSVQTILAGTQGKDCQAAFTYFSNLTKDSSIQFSNQSIVTGSTGYIWNFGDSKTSTLANPSHHFNDSGYFNVCLTVSARTGGCHKSHCQFIKAGNTKADCYIKFDYTIDTAAHQVLFQDRSIGNPVSYRWYFGSGDSSILQNPEFSYSSNGYYPVRLIALTSSGCRGEYLQLIGIHEDSLKAVFMVKGQGFVNFDKINEGPYSIGISNLEDNRLKSVSLNGTAYGDPSEFYWDFGDGTVDSTTLSPTHTYANFGTYDVCLTIVDPQTNEQNQYCNKIKVDSTTNLATFDLNEKLSVVTYPDPIHNILNIQYSLPTAGKVDISIFDQLGRKLVTIVNCEEQAGIHNLSWQNTGLDNGVYFLKFTTDHGSIVKRIMVVNSK